MPNGERKIHNRLAVLRIERGMSRLDLARALGVNYQTVGYLERGDYSPSLELALRGSDSCRCQNRSMATPSQRRCPDEARDTHR